MDGLLSEIDVFLAESQMAPSTFGRKSVGDAKFIGRLRSGKRCWPETAQKARRFMQKIRAIEAVERAFSEPTIAP